MQARDNGLNYEEMQLEILSSRRFHIKDHRWFNLSYFKWKVDARIVFLFIKTSCEKFLIDKPYNFSGYR